MLTRPATRAILLWFLGRERIARLRITPRSVVIDVALVVPNIRIVTVLCCRQEIITEQQDLVFNNALIAVALYVR